MIEQRNNSNKDNCMKINIIKPSDGEESVNNIKSPNLLSLNLRIQKRKKSNIQQKMENSLCIKKYTNEHGTHGANILKEYHKSKTIIKPNAKESSSNLEYNTLTDNCSKNVDEQKSNMSQNQDISQNQDTSQNQSPSQNQKIQNQIQNHNAKQEIKHNINYNININNSNPNELLNILKLTNNLYSGESHLQKEISTKKLELNNLSKFNSNFSNNNLTKNKLFIQFGLKNIKRRSWKSNFEESLKDKTNSHLKSKGYNEDEMIYENKIESNDSNENIKINEHNNLNNFIIANNSSKSEKNSPKNFCRPRRRNSKSKFEREKNKKEKEKAKKESSKNSRKSSKTMKEHNKTNNNTHKLINKKIEENNEENKIDNSNINSDKQKKNKFRFCNLFCCLNS